MAGSIQCDSCAYYEYDEEFEEYFCSVNMDEDDYYHYLTDESNSCKYYRDGDEYKVVRHQL